ncbi:MAG TPA: hydroxyacylglutathione hydrolase [Anaerohalosphaeraceae bacterium]|nr:hydroxyacylglutathione hydrolase [Anaerohalosphaeraceae bacterium]HPO70416.1 hydroxyacylglutathione hydrolase [Anaerohalosphaeraceae bacterium]HRV20940.1 hydroxyacylglutathione hydrolase [Anaerohalosphaeraceae bacterium]
MNPQEPVTVMEAGDNYIYLLDCGQDTAAAVDPSDAQAVLAHSRRRQLTAVLATHHHSDHTGGIACLKKQTGCLVIGPGREHIPCLDRPAADGDVFQLGRLTVRCIETPGHTTAGLCYLITTEAGLLLFTGDTLFICGCGRVLETDMETMFQSLQKLKALPDETLVYPGHAYTEENIRFALTVEPDNRQLRQKLAAVCRLRRQNLPAVPSLLGEEKRLNPFLRAADWQAFARLRKLKDAF